MRNIQRALIKPRGSSTLLSINHRSLEAVACCNFARTQSSCHETHMTLPGAQRDPASNFKQSPGLADSRSLFTFGISQVVSTVASRMTTTTFTLEGCQFSIRGTHLQNGLPMNRAFMIKKRRWTGIESRLSPKPSASTFITLAASIDNFRADAFPKGTPLSCELSLQCRHDPFIQTP